jgi:DNA-directed RNA polymerase specialized sigma24 family protein
VSESLPWLKTDKAREVLLQAIMRRQRAGLLLSEIAERLRVPLKTVQTVILSWLRHGD